MSTWNLGINDVTEQEQAMKDKLSSKDGHIAALQTQLMKQSQELRELQETYNENIRKLADETNRALQLEADLNARSESLRNEKIASQNLSQALAAAKESIKQKDLDTRDLQVNLESLSHLSDSHKSQADKLAKEKATLEARVRELQATNNQTSVPPTTPGHRRPATRSRSRSSSPSRARITALEQELVQARSLLSQKEADVLLANEKAARAQDELIRVGNEKIAVERQMTRRLAETQAALEEKEEELRDLQGMLGNGNRERELEQRIEEDEAKMSAMEKSHRAEEAEWRRRVKELENEVEQQHHRLTEAEGRQDGLRKEKDEVVSECDNLRARLSCLEETLRSKEAQMQERDTDEHTLRSSSSEADMDVDDATVTHVERLLNAINRLRAERDALQARMDFLQLESKCEIEALHAKLAAASKAPLVTAVDEESVKTIDQLKAELAALTATVSQGTTHGPADSPTKQKDSRSLHLAAAAFAAVIQHLHSHNDALKGRISDTCHSRDQIQRQLLSAQQNLDELEEKLKGLEVKLDVTVLCLEATTSQRDDLLSQLERKDAELEQAADSVKAAEDSQDYFKQQLDIVESERNSLSLQAVNLENDLAEVRNNLRAAESRYSELQFHQLADMSKSEAMRLMQNELTEERARVRRRDEHIVALGHDIQRLETNLRLQEDRLGEMTAEIEVITAEKNAMIEDCANVRDERDRAEAKFDMMETKMEAQLEDRERVMEALVEVIMKTAANARESIRIQTHRARVAAEASARLQGEHRNDSRMMEEALAGHDAGEEVEEAVRQSTLALAVSQVGLAKAEAYIRKVMEEKEILEREIRSQHDELDHQAAERETLQKRHETLQHQVASAALDFANRTAELEQQIQGLQKRISDTETTHRRDVEELLRAKEDLATALEQAQSSLADDSNDALVRVREQHAVELSKVEARLSESLAALEDLRSSQAATKEGLEKSLADALDAKQVLEQQLAENSESLRQSAFQRQETEARREDIEREALRLQKDLDTALSQKQAMEAARDHLQASLERVSEELEAVRAQQEEHVAEVTERHLCVERQLETELTELRTRLDGQRQEMEQVVQERDRLVVQLEDELSSHSADQAAHDKELSLLEQQCTDAQSASARLQHEMQLIRSQLEKSLHEVEDLHQEKLSLQQETTTLEAEIQRSISLGRFLESQVKDSEVRITSLTEELKQLQEELARSEKAAKAAEVNLSLQGAQHKREVSELNRQLAALQSQPNLQKALAELEERNNEMEELLRNKCAEIEENDDRALEMLKENKKLTTKVEALTRKVQNLQTKLAAAKASMAAPSNPIASAPVQSSSKAPAPPVPGSESRNPGTRPRSTTLTNPHAVAAVSPVPPLPTYVPSVPAHDPSPATRTPIHRAVSGPSSLPRPKTPERRAVQPAPVFKARTPERRTVSSPPEASSSSTTIGKKRRAPDDFEACEKLPPQGFTVDSLPSREGGEDTSTTPRVRRVLSGFQSGFTPVRNQARPVISIPSPKRLMMGTTARSSPVIADVTNSPRGQSAKAKRSWLGKIRGVSSQATSRPVDSRPRLEREAS
ncbi:hypothetical protein LshimejAT787_0301140 [Lyophyllum shimeji]|uniref:Uncharacterized protein n=1 Tax=Lyophyllum shimeji TaxID=47721 RepID=A0A9P3PHC0_LYOSH|nr:hypothetical protein LshimejAT787_0301140 [Lyophyllum shimeji]